MSALPLGLNHLGLLDLAGAQAIQAAIAQAGLGTTGNIFYCDPVNGLDTNLAPPRFRTRRTARYSRSRPATPCW